MAKKPRGKFPLADGIKWPRPKGPKPSDPPLVLYAVKGYGCDTYFGEATFDTMEDGAKVCVYDLREVRVMHVTKGLR